MDLQTNQRRALLTRLFVGALLALCGVLGAMQYHWIGEVTVAARDRLRGTLHASLLRSSTDFNAELVSACSAILPTAVTTDEEELRRQVTARYLEWKQNGRRTQMFRAIALALPQARSVDLQILDLNRGVFADAAWPEQWAATHKRLEATRLWLAGGPPPSQGEPGTQNAGEGTVFDFALFPPRPSQPQGTTKRTQIAWVIFDLDPGYVRETMLTEILQRYLGTGGNLDYQVEVASKTTPRQEILRTEGRSRDVSANADASVSLFDPQFAQLTWRVAVQAAHGGPTPVRGPAPESGRWQMFARHRAGSLEAVVAQARTRSLLLTGCVLLLMVFTIAALTRYTHRAQKLAELQMNFVAGVSHELRTPLTTIYTAGYNLQGKVAGNPVQVERYGKLIQQESGRLKQLVEQILRFATANAGRVIQEREPLSVEQIIGETVESTRPLIDQAHCIIETSVDPGLPPILGDSLALRHALQNLISNAAKYGSDGANWIGISASQTNGKEPPSIEIRVADRGPGIPVDEQEQIFDPFFRGSRAMQDQVHGTGLGLSLVKKIVEAHGGSIRVKSEPMKGAEFIVRIPVAPAPAEVAG